MKYHDVEQNTEEWYQLRSGKVTSSKLGVIMASAREFIVVKLSAREYGVLNITTKKVYKKTYKCQEDAEKFATEQKKKAEGKKFTQTAVQYASDIAIEQIKGSPIASNYQNSHMERGHEQEPYARAKYEQTMFCEVANGGFYCDEKCGCSPDGIINQDGVIEIKSVIPNVHYANINRQSLDPAYKWQCYGNLLFTGREWLDFVSYCADYPDDKQIYVYRIYAGKSQDEFSMIQNRLSLFLKLVSDMKQTILNSEYIIY